MYLKLLAIFGLTTLCACGHIERVPVQRMVAFDVPAALTEPVRLPRLPEGRIREIDPVLLWDAAEEAALACNMDKARIRSLLDAQRTFITMPTAESYSDMLKAYTRGKER